MNLIHSRDIQFRFKSLPLVRIGPEALDLMLSHIQKPGESETGGALVGSQLIDGSLLIMEAMPPSPRNKAGRHWLKRNLRDTQSWINRIHVESEGWKTYMGEWHTHPAPTTEPSGPDRLQLAQIVNRSELFQDPILGIIVGCDGGMICWAHSISGKVELGKVETPAQ